MEAGLVPYSLGKFLGLSGNHSQDETNIAELHRSNCRFHHALPDVWANEDFDVVRPAEETSGRLPQVGIREFVRQSFPG